MHISIRLLAAAIAIAAFMPGAQAQDMTSATFNGTTIWVGGGVQFLSLPDIKFTGTIQNGDFHRQKNSDFSEYGGSIGGGIETALGFWGGGRVTGGVKGFWSGLENSDRSACRSGTCAIFDPTGAPPLVGSPTLVTNTNRDVDYWGGSAELKFGSGQPTEVKPNLYRNDYFIVGADIRGIDQDNTLRGHVSGRPLIYSYNETLDTTYYGGYVGLGGEYSFGFIPGVKNVGGFYDRLGLRTFINMRAGLYQADTDYTGGFIDVTGFTSRLSKSTDDLAFIGTVSLETRKQIGMRTSLSLWTDYEYISSVPKMRYADFDRPTRIDDEGAFATRTMLRLNIGLGAAQLYDEPLK